MSSLYRISQFSAIRVWCYESFIFETSGVACALSCLLVHAISRFQAGAVSVGSMGISLALISYVQVETTRTAGRCARDSIGNRGHWKLSFSRTWYGSRPINSLHRILLQD
jgi:hypothetical protein